MTVNQGDDDKFIKLAVKALFKAADYCSKQSFHILDIYPDDEDGESRYWADHARLIRQLADEWSAPEDGWKDGNVVPFVPKSVKFKALPPERGRRES